ncbi:MAG: TonB family protein [Candidatus Sulfotelmatobacter sp.]
MAQLPMWGPDPAKTGPSSASGGLWITPEELAAPDALPPAESDLAELAAKFSAHSGGDLSKELSADLALEIVLNEIVEQACLATGATGAAIVLERDGELVCRASAGANAPELGVRLDTETGLSGACVKTRLIQRCDDAQSDPRADVEASRLLGVRAVIILPLLRSDRLLGVFEVFSSRPAAFGERDQRTLEALAQRTLKNLQRASEPLVVAAPEVTPPVKPLEERRFAEWERPEQQLADLYVPEVGQSRVRQVDGVTLALGVVVFACAVLLSTLVGLHFGRERAVVGSAHVRKAASGPINPQPNNPSVSNGAAASTGNQNEGMPNSTTAAGPSAAGAQKAGTSVAQTGTRPSVAPAGGLLVYDNGKEVFRMLPSASGGKQDAKGGEVERASSVEAAPAFPLSPDAVESSLLRRVEPEYPEEARKQGIQGPVVLDVHIGKDGAVQDVNLVSGQSILADAATSAVKQWRFKPHSVDGREVEMQTRVTLRFTLPTP